MLNKKKISVFLLSLALMVSFLFGGNALEASAATSKGGYVKSTYIAAGGRMNIEYHDLYMNVADARKYASKAEMSLAESIAWLGSSFIPGIGPFLGTLGTMKGIEGSVIASEIRKYTDKDIPVHVTLSKDLNYGTYTRIVTSWDGQKESIKPFAVPAPEYQKVVTTIYK